MTSSEKDPNVLCVGLVCLDATAVVKEFPVEDSDTRGVDQRWQRGGNASNNCTTLSHLGTRCELLASIGCHQEDIGYQFLKKDLQRHGIQCHHCVLYENHKNPMTIVIVSEQNGSRTILHQRGSLPELELKDFTALNLGVYSWIHFEGRNYKEYLKMLEFMEKWNCARSHPIPISVELEKIHLGYEALIPLADVVFISKDLAQGCGHKCKEAAAVAYAKLLKEGAIVVCPWGSDGAAAVTSDGNLISEVAFGVDSVKDTLGAGDVFIATVIHALVHGRELSSSQTLSEALRLGCRVAGAKCGFHGYDGIALLAESLIPQKTS